MSDQDHQAREHRESALNLRARAKKIEATNPERAAAWNAEAATLEAAADKLAPSKPKPTPDK